VNQLINLFTGVAEEDEEGRAVTSSGGWEAVSATGPNPGARPSSPGPIESDDRHAAELASLPESQYYALLYQEYVTAKQSVGEDVSNVPRERFIERIKGNAAHLQQKHGAKMVRFEVETIGGQVNLKPVVIH
jgi:hypothetical protein